MSTKQIILCYVSQHYLKLFSNVMNKINVSWSGVFHTVPPGPSPLDPEDMSKLRATGSLSLH